MSAVGSNQQASVSARNWVSDCEGVHNWGLLSYACLSYFAGSCTSKAEELASDRWEEAGF